MPRHLLVTNDFPPNVGGIQNYLWEIWNRLPPESFSVLTHHHEAAKDFDRQTQFRIVRSSSHVLFPSPKLLGEIRQEVQHSGSELVLLDPIWLPGMLGPRLEVPYGLVIHGSEATLPAALPGVRHLLRRTLSAAEIVVTASLWAIQEVRNSCFYAPEVVYVPPSVDTTRFCPLGEEQRSAVRRRLGIAPEDLLVLCVSRLIPRKGMDVLIEAMARLMPGRPGLRALIAGGGRDRHRLESLIARRRAPVKLLGKVGDAFLPNLYAAADVFAMFCRDRWAGIEQEGFGIVFLEAAAAGVPQVAGASGGSSEAVVEGETGLIVHDPSDPAEAAEALAALLDDPPTRLRMGAAARARATREFTCEHLAARLSQALDAVC